MKKLYDRTGLDGWFNIKHFRNGELLSEEIVHNTTTTVGRKRVAGLINERVSGAGQGFNYLAIGSSGTVSTSASTALTTELTYASFARTAATCTWQTTTTASDTARLVHTWTSASAGTVNVRECGILDTASGGNMLAKTTFAAKAMANADTLAINYSIKVS